MTVAFLAAVVSAVAMAAVYLLDMVMSGDSYTKPSQPMFVSSVLSLAPVPVLFLWGVHTPPTSAALMAFGAGAILMVANWLYFIVIYSDVGECTETAVFETSSVLLVAAIIAGAEFMDIVLHDHITSWQLLGVVIGGMGLIMVHFLGERLELVDTKHRLLLIGFMICGACYELLIDRSIFLAVPATAGAGNPEQAAYLAVSPYFWMGLATGVVAVFRPQEWRAFQDNWKNLKKSWRLVLLAEVLALVAFGAAVFGFAEGHVATIAFIAGTFPVLVMVGGAILRRQFGYSDEKFPPIQKPIPKLFSIALVILGIVLVAG